MSWLTVLNHDVVACTRCPRLVVYREQIARDKSRAYRDWEYWANPVPGVQISFCVEKRPVRRACATRCRGFIRRAAQLGSAPATDPHDFASRTNFPNLAASILDTRSIHRSTHGPR